MSSSIRSILIVDDDEDDYEILKEAIQEIDDGIQLFFVQRCEDAPEFLAKGIDIILLDINMPYHDGFSWLAGLRNYGYSHPIVMYTNSQSPANIRKAYTEGADLYFPKPDSFSELLNGLKKLIQLNWRDRASVRESHVTDHQYRTFSY